MKKLLSLTIMGMFMLLTFQNQSIANPNRTFATAVSDLDDFYKYLGSTVLYPSRARLNNLQGNSIILFTVNAGKVKDLKIQTALGDDCDGEVLNRVLAYPNFAKMKSGKYALKTTFKFDDLNQKLTNADAKSPVGYIELKIVITGYAKEATAKTSRSDRQIFGEGIRLKGNKDVVIMSSNDRFKTTDKEPMVILDDNVMEYGSLHSIDPNNIQSITILKDMTAVAKYGIEAKNGVIIITSKDFVPKKIKVEVDTLKKN